MSGGGKKGGPKRRVVDYFMSMHYGFCTGPVDELLAIKIKDLVAWSGSVTANTVLNIDQPNLFGGDKKEGGAVGSVEVLFGGPTQILSPTFANKLGLTSATSPGFRGVMSLAFYQATRGFMWSQNNPYLPGVAATVRRIPLGLNPTTARIVRDGITDVNPAHIMHECYTNTDWGLGWPTTRFDVANWDVVAQTLYDEGFGLSLQWVNTTEVESFVSEIQDHIQASIYEDPTTGLLSIKLIRDDYDINTAFEINPSNATLSKAERRSLDDTINEIIVTWTNPLNEKEETVAAQDLGNIAAQGRIVSETRNYYGARTQSLAMDLARRDLRASSYPLFSCEAAVDRTARQIIPGEVVRLVWPERGISAMACRVMDVDYGKPGSGQILLTLVEDIFGLEEGSFSTVVGTLWTDVPATALPFVTTDFLTSPYPILARAGQSGLAYPGVYVGVLAREEQIAMSSFILTTEVVRPDGSVQQQDYTGQLSTPVATTTVALTQQATSTLSSAQLGAFSENYVPASGDLIYAAGVGDSGSEVMMLTAFSAGNWTVERGIYDTIPRDWPAGTSLWVMSSLQAYDPNVRSPGAATSYWLRPVTLAGPLPLASAVEEIFTPSERPHLPFRPTDVRIAGVTGFGTYTYAVLPVNITVSWKNRNRVMEDTVALLWNDPTTTGEAGQTTTVRVRDTAGAFIIEYTGIAGVTFDVPVADVIGVSTIVVIEVISVRGGFESLQYQARQVELPAEGYGIGYGIYYG